jgi:hypothetical protein
MKNNWAAVVVAVSCATFLRADVIFSTLDGTPTGEYQIIADTDSGAESAALSFQSSTAFSLTGVTLEFTALNGATFNLTLLSSDPQGMPGALMETLGTSLSAPSAGALISVSPLSPLTLAADAAYWLLVTPTSADTLLSQGTTAQSVGISPTSPLAIQPVQFQIDGLPRIPPITTYLPEPSSLGLMGIGLGLLLMACQEKVRQALAWPYKYSHLKSGLNRAKSVSALTHSQPNSIASAAWTASAVSLPVQGPDSQSCR